MGNLCGKPSTSSAPPNKPSDPFSRPGRTLGDATPRAAVPQAQKIGGGGEDARGKILRGDGERERNEAMSAAARAAEARNSNPQKPKGKLAKELDRQKAQTMSESLNQASREERRRREVDGLEEERNFN